MILFFESCDGTDGETTVAAVVARIVEAAAEDEVAHITGIDERTGPVVAVRAVSLEVVPVAVARSGEIDKVSVLYADNLIAIDVFTCGIFTAHPCPCAVIFIA